MAAYREHLTTSSVLGIGVCSAAIAMGFTPVQGVLAGTITGIGGILPDLDSESGRPVREVFGVTAALAPVVMLRRLEGWGGNTDGAMLLAVLLYVTVKYGGQTLLGILAYHRGMFHSIPAMVIAGELAFLGYKSEQIAMKILMGGGIMIGFFSHLLLDELYAVEWRGIRLRANKFSGSAIKFLGKSWSANIFTYGLMFILGYSVWVEGGLRQMGYDIPVSQPTSKTGTPQRRKAVPARRPTRPAPTNLNPMNSNPTNSNPFRPSTRQPFNQSANPPPPLSLIDHQDQPTKTSVRRLAEPDLDAFR
jgi:membrane-bound metal-dependent hydrolase YbcI (DUF457 family)